MPPCQFFSKSNIPESAVFVLQHAQRCPSLQLCHGAIPYRQPCGKLLMPWLQYPCVPVYPAYDEKHATHFFDLPRMRHGKHTPAEDTISLQNRRPYLP
jgi:hypothetical protein